MCFCWRFLKKEQKNKWGGRKHCSGGGGLGLIVNKQSLNQWMERDGNFEFVLVGKKYLNESSYIEICTVIKENWLIVYNSISTVAVWREEVVGCGRNIYKNVVKSFASSQLFF